MLNDRRIVVALEVGVGEPSVAHDATLSAGLQILVAVHRHDGPSAGGKVSIDVVGAVDACERPAVLLQDAAHAFAGDDLHGASPLASRAKASS